MGGPYGADTATGSADFKQGWGAFATAGYAFVPNFGIGAFLHYNTTKLVFHDSYSARRTDENSGHVILYGLEARGVLGSRSLLGYASFGIALGSGSLSLTETSSSYPGEYTLDERDSLDFNPMPVLGFGVEAEIAEGFHLGPVLRWYLVSANEACTERTAKQSGASSSSKECLQDFSNVELPDIVFVGAGVTFRP